MSEVANQGEPDCRAIEGLSIKGRDEKNDGDGGNAEGAEGLFIQNQIILFPEIMNNILEHLDVWALKRVRLVCKSWLLEAQSHMERRSIVWLNALDSQALRMLKFTQVRTNKVPGLPQPFKSLAVDLEGSGLAVRTLSDLCPPLVITRFAARCSPLALALPLIIQCSSSLEYLKLAFGSCDTEGHPNLKQINQSVKFPKLRLLDVATDFDTTSPNDFPRLLRWITRASPNLDEFGTYFTGNISKELSSAVLLAVDLEKLTTLKLEGPIMDRPILKLFSSIPFPNKLQHLSWYGISGESAGEVLRAILKKAASTLRKLELRDWNFEAESEFPVCPNVQELHLIIFPGWGDFIFSRFPSLQDFRPEILGTIERPCYYGVFPRNYEELFPATPAFVNVKTLSLRSLKYSGGSIRPMELFSTFPALESLQIRQSYLFEHYRRKTTWDPKVLDLLGGLKHLVLRGGWDKADDVAWYSFLTQLRELETLTITTWSSDQLLLIPFQEMPSLRVLRVQWMFDSNEKLRQLLEITRGLEKVVILDCCYHMRSSDSYNKYKDLLNTFFNSAPNAVCGSKESLYFFDTKSLF